MLPHEFRAFLNLLMCSDPWPADDADRVVLEQWADQQAKQYGFSNWIEAYHHLASKEN